MMQPRSFSPDYIGTALLASLILHGVIIFGIRAQMPRAPKTPDLITLDVVLLQSSPGNKPKQADFLAQHAQEGHGNTTIKQPPRRPRQIAPPPVAPAVAAKPQPVAVPKTVPTPKLLTTQQARAKVQSPPPAEPSTPSTLALKAEPKKIEPKAPTRAEPTPMPPVVAKPSAAALMQAIAVLDDAIDENRQVYAEQPRQKYISARTYEYHYASYMDAWRSKVERIGNLNYPAAIKQHQLTGNVLLDVIVKPDGSLHDVVVITSSGNPVIDTAAINIARMAAPYASFPADIRAETDLLHITRTWKFLRDNRLLSQ